MKYLSFLMTFILSFLVVGNGRASLSSEEDKGAARVLPGDYFHLHSQCIASWSELMSEWKANGGGVKGSIKEARKQIEMDESSRFSSLVRMVWRSQKNAEGFGSIGYWPISDNKYRRVFENFIFPEDKRLPVKDCQSFSWIQSMLWDDVRILDKDGRVGARKMLETPKGMNWESPWVQQWIEYWIFVRID